MEWRDPPCRVHTTPVTIEVGRRLRRVLQVLPRSPGVRGYQMESELRIQSGTDSLRPTLTTLRPSDPPRSSKATSVEGLGLKREIDITLLRHVTSETAPTLLERGRCQRPLRSSLGPRPVPRSVLTVGGLVSRTVPITRPV